MNTMRTQSMQFYFGGNGINAVTVRCVFIPYFGCDHVFCFVATKWHQQLCPSQFTLITNERYTNRVSNIRPTTSAFVHANANIFTEKCCNQNALWTIFSQNKIIKRSKWFITLWMLNCCNDYWRLFAKRNLKIISLFCLVSMVSNLVNAFK